MAGPPPTLPPELAGLTVQAVLEAAPDALVIVDATGRIVLANPQAEALFGYPRSELIGSSVDRLVPDAVRGGHAAHRARFMGDARARPMGAALDLRARRKDGSELPVEISLSPLRTSAGMLVAAAIRDVTERRKMEQRFRGLLEAAPDGMIIVDPKGTIVLANAQAERLFGYPRSELIGSSVDRLVPDAVRGGHAAHRARFMSDAKARPMGAGLDLRARRKDGSELPVEISLSPLDLEGERLVMAAVRDISDRRRLEADREQGRQRERELEQLRQVDQFKTTFLNTAAHELRTPMLPVKTQFHLLKTRLGASADPDIRQGIEVIDRNITRLAGLVEDLLDAARYQAGRVQMNAAPTDLARLAQEAAASFRAAAEERRIALELDLRPAPIVADAARLTQVLFNLLGNAVKFTRDDGRIRVEVRADAASATVRVVDSGIGLQREEIAKLFQPFAQLHESVLPGQRGSGLGLYISRGLVEAHGGRIWAESAGLDRGSTFAFTVPATPAARIGSGPGDAPGTAFPSGQVPEGAPGAGTTGGTAAVR